ncbi:MAG: universal stress protein [Bacteroidota bacterium]
MNIYRHVGIAVALSPRLQPLLNEAAVQARPLSRNISLVHVGEGSPDAEDILREALTTAGLPAETPIIWREGQADEALLSAVAENDIDLLVAGALERESGLRYYLGSVARNLVRESPFSLLLFTNPRLEPRPMKRAVLVTDYSENSLIALMRLVRYAEASSVNEVYVVRALSDFGDAIVLSEGMSKEQEKSFQKRSLSEEEHLVDDFVDAVGGSSVQIIPKILQGHSGYVVSAFAREQGADLLVMPSASQGSHFFERLFPSDMEWVLREIPCNLWVVRDVLPVA